MKTNQTNYIHMRSPSVSGVGLNNYGGCTIAYQISDDNKILVGYAVCCNNDPYVKSVGRQIARQRMNQVLAAEAGSYSYSLSIEGAPIFENFLSTVVSRIPFSDKKLFEGALRAAFGTKINNLSKSVVDQIVSNAVSQDAESKSF